MPWSSTTKQEDFWTTISLTSSSELPCWVHYVTHPYSPELQQHPPRHCLLLSSLSPADRSAAAWHHLGACIDCTLVGGTSARDGQPQPGTCPCCSCVAYDNVVIGHRCTPMSKNSCGHLLICRAMLHEDPEKRPSAEEVINWGNGLLCAKVNKYQQEVEALLG